jgi:amidase
LFTAEAEFLDICRTAAEQITAAGGTFAEAAPNLPGSMQILRTLRGLGYRQLGQAIPRDRWLLMKATVVENIEFGLSITIDDVLRAEALRGRLHVQMTKFFDQYDVLALPAAQVAPFPVETEFPMEIDGVAMADYLEWMTTCCAITPTGGLALSLPAGLTCTGLPVGLQLVARAGNDRALLEVAAALGAANPQYQRVPALMMA